MHPRGPGPTHDHIVTRFTRKDRFPDLLNDHPVPQRLDRNHDLVKAHPPAKTRFGQVQSESWTTSVPATASNRIRSSSRTRLIGPPEAASGVRWIAAGILPEAPDMRPSVTSATWYPRSCSTPSTG